jgi:hypothetical protein
VSSKGNSREDDVAYWCSREGGGSKVRLASVWEEGEGRNEMSVQKYGKL